VFLPITQASLGIPESSLSSRMTEGLLTVDDDNCNLPSYYAMVEAIAFVSSIALGSCVAATLQVATADRLAWLAFPFYANAEAKMEIEAGITIETFVLVAKAHPKNLSTGDADVEKGRAPKPEGSIQRNVCQSWTRRAWSFVKYLLLDHMNGSVGKDRVKVAVFMFAFSSCLYGIAFVFSLQAQILLT